MKASSVVVAADGEGRVQSQKGTRLCCLASLSSSNVAVVDVVDDVELI